MTDRPRSGDDEAVFTPGRVVAVWAVVATVFVAQSVASSLMQGRPVDWQWNVYHELLYIGLWGCCTPIVVRQARRYWIEPGAGPRPWVVHLVTALVLSPIQVAATYLVHGLALLALGAVAPADLSTWFGPRGRAVLALSPVGVLYYWIILGVFYAAAYRRLYLGQRAAAAEASLDALRAQLQPHFLFNTLNSVAVLVEENPSAASRVLLRLSDLLRMVLRHEPRHEVPLEEEAAGLDGYLDIQRVRFEERLTVEVLMEPAAQRALVPWLVLQPLVENAIRYAVEPRAAGGRVIVRGAREGDRLRLSVEDDGPGMDAGSPGRNGDGVGLANTRERLALLYGQRHTFRIESVVGGGCRVVIELPYREAP